jgi:hypothetical protein
VRNGDALVGFGSTDLHMVAYLRRQGWLPQNGAIAELGAQQLNDSLIDAPAEIADAGQAFGASGPMPLFTREAGTPDNPLAGTPYARALWQWLGYDYTAIDIDGSPDSIPLDLNFDEVPRPAVGRFQLVTNYGTTEHAVNQLQAFKIIHDLTARDGIMIHVVPGGRWLDHGLLNYTFKFFSALARGNRYHLISLRMSPPEPEPVPAGIIDLIAQFDPNGADRLRDCTLLIFGIHAVYRKVHDGPFVPPLDIGENVRAANAQMLKRYPNWFEAEPKDRSNLWTTVRRLLARLR